MTKLKNGKAQGVDNVCRDVESRKALNASATSTNRQGRLGVGGDGRLLENEYKHNSPKQREYV